MVSAAPQGKRLVVLADVHGNWPTMLDLMRETGAIDEEGAKDPGTWVCQLGDLLHLGHDVWETDAETLRLGLELIDCLLLGNHELPFATSIGLGFAGMHAGINIGLHPDTRRQLNGAMRHGRLQAAVAADGWLVTHAGLCPTFMHGSSMSPRYREELLSHAGSAGQMAAHLNERLERRLIDHEADPVFDWVGAERAGRQDFGGIFWCGWQVLKASIRRFGTPFPQIVGHTPRSDSAPMTDPTSRAWNIDLAGVDAGFMAALVKEPGAGHWTCKAVRRRRRPPSSLGRGAAPEPDEHPWGGEPDPGSYRRARKILF